MFKVKRSRVICISVILTGLLYICDPFSKPTITINPPSKSFDLELPKDFVKCELIFKKEINIFNYSMALTSEDESGKHRSLIHQIINQKVISLPINNLIANDKTADKDPEAKALRIKILFESSSPLEITTVFIDHKIQDNEDFYLKYLFSDNKKLRKYRYIRRDISNILLRYNDTLSNVILTILTVSLIPLFYEIIRRSYRGYIANNMEAYLKSEFDLSNEEAINNTQISYGENHERRESMYRLFQIMGPAIGFTLTISSLIVGLHPSLLEVQNIKIFFETIQVAMVSTFLGLLIRIMAILLQRIDNRLLIQADDILFQTKEKLNNHNDA